MITTETKSNNDDNDDDNDDDDDEYVDAKLQCYFEILIF